MKLCIAGLILVSLLTMSTEAQTSIGLPSNEPKPLKDFRLPDWGYSSANIRLYITGSGNSDKSEARKNYSMGQYYLLRPTYNFFKESESRSLSFSAYLTKSYSFYNSRQTNYEYDDLSKQKNSSDSWQLYLKNETHNYYEKYYVRVTPDFNYYRNHRKYKFSFDDLNSGPPSIYSSKRKTYDRFYDAKFSLAFGQGRIRNVTPVIRALRLNERFKALGKNIELNQSEIEEAAAEFTRYPGYLATYDRPEKFFWKSFSEKLSGLTPFETHYLHDIFDEVVGERFEGSELDLGARITRMDILQETEMESDNEKSKLKATFAGPEISAQLYNNYSLKGQIGFTGKGNWDFRMNKKEYNPIKNAMQFQLSAEHLYVISDQTLWKVSPSYSWVTVKSDNPFGDDKYTSSLITLTSSVIYFVENRFNIEGSVNWSYLKNKPSSDLEGYLPADASYYLGQASSIFDLVEQKSSRQWQFRITINYYLTRQMY